MADLLGTVPSAEKETENKDKKKEKRPWDDIPRSGEIGKTPDLAETLGFYDINAVRREQRERDNSDPSLARFMCAELTRGYFLEHNEAKYTERRERVYTCMRIPRELEKLMIFGFFLCLDAFLYVFTLLPLRVLLALLHLVTLPCCSLGGSRLLQPAQVCDILKGLIMVLCYSMMHYVDYSMMYHLIRGQSVIKLYIIYNMLECFPEPLSPVLHAILIMVQASTLNVAFNSHNKSLLTIMMSNNFVEIKGSVFKKFEKNNLFQMSNSDIKERFTSYVLLLIVCLRNMEQFSWSPDHLWVLLPDVFMVIASEIAVDVIKHAFITKFNEITADVYSEYRASLAFDLVSCRQKNACTDYSDSVARRMGFIPLPLAVLLIRVVMSSVNVQGALSYSCVFLFYMGMVTLKVLNSIVLLGKSCVYVKRANMEDKLFEKPPTAVPGMTPSRTSKTSRCTAPSGDLSGDPWSERSPSTPSCTSIPPSSSVTTQPTPTVIPNPQAETVAPPATSPTTTPTRPSSTSPEPDPDTLTPSPPATPEQKEGDGTEGTELKHRTPKKDLLDVDRFTICGNRID
ncbi:transmembrane anterior posterior transformation protein 1 homolog isoform X4 [Oncorhynchus kisutch]|uniref:transmembrane anterior posterior transformation protein 1 homolog isoform X4 n=1 Tax=Oncorhynchus kisutch TaxID=8019 RepID=UPI0012DE1DAE|nr:transmembrane anterior posterior transformation protein 1 homolog isoform X4 [Oncorhynchus kisutch]